MLYRIECNREKCNDCRRCEEHWPGVIRKFNCQGFFDLDKAGFYLARNQYEWVKNLCPEDAINLKVIREEEKQNMPVADEL